MNAIPCRYCDKILKYKNESAGKWIKCPGCDKNFELPRDGCMKCEKCKSNVFYNNSMLGATASCPKCNDKIVIPTIEERQAVLQSELDAAAAKWHKQRPKADTLIELLAEMKSGHDDVSTVKAEYRLSYMENAIESYKKRTKGERNRQSYLSEKAWGRVAFFLVFFMLGVVWGLIKVLGR